LPDYCVRLRISILEILECIPVVEIIAFLVLGQNWMLFKGLSLWMEGTAE